MTKPFTPNILITGAKGQLGQALSKHFGGSALALGRAELNLGDPASIRAAIRKHQPRIIINAGAYTAVDQAEVEPAVAHAVNAQAPGILAEEAAALDATVVHFSSDYVFDGAGNQPYREDHPCAPQSMYGESKRQGEIALLQSAARHLIFRTSWVYAGFGANFMLTMLKLAQGREELSVIDDQWGVPTWVGRLVALSAMVVQRIEQTGVQTPDASLLQASTVASPLASGLYHLCPKGETTWYRYASKVFELHPDAERKLRHLIPITSEQYETNLRAGNPTRIVAKRPHNSRLDCSKLEKAFGIALPAWEEDLAACLNEIRLKR
jgi:dTDP-4-dehydrorhamnose reductase